MDKDKQTKLEELLTNKQFVPLKLTGWDLEEVREFIQFNLQTTAVAFTEAEIRELYKQTQGHPVSLVKSSFQLFSQKKEARH